MNKNIKIILYPLITILVFGVSGLFIFNSINFVSDKISDIFITDQARVEANIVKLNLEGYENVADRLNVEGPAVQEPQETEEPEEEVIEE